MSPREPHPEDCACITCLRDARPCLAALDAAVAPAAPAGVFPLRRSQAPTVLPPPSARCAGCRRVLLLTSSGESLPCEYCAPREGDPVERTLALGEQMAAAGEAFEAATRAYEGAVAGLTLDQTIEVLRRQVARLLREQVRRG